MPWKAAKQLKSGDTIAPQFGAERQIESTEILSYTNQVRVKFVGGGVQRYSLATNIFVKD